ncbi:MAG: response regulator [Myxococcota bacterium]
MPTTSLRHDDGTRPLRVLYVDDESLVRKAFGRAMRRYDMSITLAAHPHEALALWNAASDGFDVVVSDLNMPDMNGLELIEAIHDQSGHDAFIVLSGVGVLETRCGVPGVRYVPKPWSPDQLADAIYALAPQRSVARAG